MIFFLWVFGKMQNKWGTCEQYCLTSQAIILFDMWFVNKWLVAFFLYNYSDHILIISGIINVI